MIKPSAFIALLAFLFCANNVYADDSIKFEAHGFVSTTGYYQSTPSFLLNGQGPLIALSPNDKVATTGFDARQTRLSFSLTGPTILNGATPKAVIETDFFGLDSAGSYGEISALPRLRLAYAELNWGETSVRIGQDWELLNAGVPTTLSHMAYPLFGAGFIGWREPGVGVFHTIDLGKSKLEVAGQILKSDWEGPTAFGLTTNNDKNVDDGQLSGMPGVEARVKWTLENTVAYVGGHWNRVGASHANQQVNTGADTTTGTAPTRNFDVVAGKIGARTKLNHLTLQGEFYGGKNLGPVFGNLAQFPVQNDIREIGGWAQVGYDFFTHWSAFGTYGTSQPNSRDAAEANGKAAGAKEPRLSNTLEGLLIAYREGGFAVGPEIFFVRTVQATGTADNRQYTITANYAF